MQTDSRKDKIEAMQLAFTEKYDEPIPMDKLEKLTAQYGSEVVARVIDQMKPDAYEAADYLVKCLNSGWYQNDGKPKAQEGKASTVNGMSDAAADTLRFTWNYKMERGWIDKAERDYMLDIFLNGTTPDIERVQDINFRCLQGMYPDAPATWFYWLPQHQRRAAANTWIVQSGREDLKPYDFA